MQHHFHNIHFVVIGLLYKAYPRLPATPAQTKALPCEGASALVSLSQSYHTIMQHYSRTATAHLCKAGARAFDPLLSSYSHSYTLTPVNQSEAHVSTSGPPSELPHQLRPVSHPLGRLLTDNTHPAALGTHAKSCLVYKPSPCVAIVVQLPANLDRG